MNNITNDKKLFHEMMETVAMRAIYTLAIDSRNDSVLVAAIAPVNLPHCVAINTGQNYKI